LVLAYLLDTDEPQFNVVRNVLSFNTYVFLIAFFCLRGEDLLCGKLPAMRCIFNVVCS